MPISWQCALVVLLSKSDGLDDPSEFRPIALLNAEGRLFFTLVQWKLSSYFVGNGYITTDTLAEILREIDSSLNDYEVEQIVEEVDEDASGTVDFDEFMAMMTGE